MSKSMNGCLRSSRGQSVVGLALVLPIMLLFVCGIIDFGRIIYKYEVVAQASHQAAIAVAKSGNRKSANTAAIYYLPNDGYLKVTVDPATSALANNPVMVTVSYPVELFFPLAGLIGTNPYIVSGSSTEMLQVKLK